MNIQNLPRHDGENKDSAIIHRIFKPKLDALMFFDWKSMELVVLAYYLSKALGDHTLRDELMAGVDLHTTAAEAAIGKVKFFHGVRARDVGKKLNYSLVYGGGAPTISEQLGIPLPAAAQAVNAYHKNRPALRQLSNALEKSYNRKGYIKTLHGRELKCDSPHKLPNVLIQGSCAEIMKRSGVKIWMELQRQGWDPRDLNPKYAHIVAAIHDEFVLDAPEHQVESVALVVPELMRDLKIEKFLPLETDIEITRTTWADKESYYADAA